MNQILSLGLDENTSLANAERNLSASAKFALSAGLVKMTITGGSVANAVAISDLQSFRNYVSQINPTVAGVQAVPIFYTLRYAADEAPALIGAVASYNDWESLQWQYFFLEYREQLADSGSNKWKHCFCTSKCNIQSKSNNHLRFECQLHDQHKG
jgi:hypothetical protein